MGDGDSGPAVGFGFTAPGDRGVGAAGGSAGEKFGRMRGRLSVDSGVTGTKTGGEGGSLKQGPPGKPSAIK